MKLGVIGYGGRIRDVILQLQKVDASCRVVAIVDVRREELQANPPDSGAVEATYYNTVAEMLNGVKLDGVLIGTRCSVHADLALQVLPSGLPLFLEKPVATTLKDLYRLKQGYEASRSQVVVSFPLKLTSVVTLAKDIISSGKIGTVEHVQAINNVPYGGVYFQSWYRDELETGGLFLQKATHDLDYINSILGLKPVAVCAMTSKQIFKGNKPAGLECENCSENHICPESTFKNNQVGEWKYCCFAEDTGNEDSGSALIRYETGMHASYSQNFFVRREAGARNARFLGYKGSLELDFITGKVKVMMHHTTRVEYYDLGMDGEHFGGDKALASNFVDLMRGECLSLSPLEDGLESALICLKARESAQTGTFQSIEW